MLKEMNNLKPSSSLRWFLITVFVLSWSLAGVFYLVFPNKDKIPFTIMAVIYMFMPALSVIIVDKLIVKRSGFRSLAVNFRPNRWYLAAWPGILLVSFLIIPFNILFPGITFSPDMSGFYERMSSQFTPDKIELMKTQMNNLPIPFLLFSILQALLAGISINAVAGFGEELGWRGLMVREYKNLHFWDASMRIGIIWGIWHAPIIAMGHNYPEHPLIGIGMMVAWCMMLSPIFLFIRIKTHSVIGASILHGTLNASAGFGLLFLSGGNDLTAGLTGFAGFITLTIVIAILVVFDLKFSKQSVTNKTIIEGVKR
jgi:hypothetical protein